jgi:DNA (cytosine-5)-methyltransferase 1
MPIEIERLQGFPEGWTLRDEDASSDADKVDSQRYHAVGNAVTVPVAEWIAHRIDAYLARQSVDFDVEEKSLALV